MNILVVTLIIFAFIFIFIDGMSDGRTVIATFIASRSINAKKALLIACCAEIVGPLISGTAVATTIGRGVIKFNYINTPGKYSIVVILSALIGAVVWNFMTWKLGIPSSSSYGLIGGLLGSGIAGYGIHAIDWNTFLGKIVLFMFLSPLIGFLSGYFLMKLNVFIFKDFKPSVNNFFKKIQIASVIFLSACHGASDSQKSSGIIALALMLGKVNSSFIVPKWALVMSSLVLMSGILAGGGRIIKTVGYGIYNVKPLHSFNVQLSSALVVFVSNILGAPVSTAQIVNSSIMGIGSAERVNAVKWFKVKNIVLSWFITIPCAALFSAGVFYLLKLALGILK